MLVVRDPVHLHGSLGLARARIGTGSPRKVTRSISTRSSRAKSSSSAPWVILRTSCVTKLKDPFGGVALNREAKEVMVMENDHRAALLIYHLPEVFQ